MFIQRLESCYQNKITPKERQFVFIEDFHSKIKPQELLIQGLEYHNAENCIWQYIAEEEKFEEKQAEEAQSEMRKSQALIANSQKRV